MKKDEKIKTLIIETGFSEEIINRVINDMLSNANEALLNNDTIELSGFGKFIMNRGRMKKDAIKCITLIKDILETGRKKNGMSLESAFNLGKQLTNRIDEIELAADIGRLEEQAYSKGFLKRND